LPGADIRTTNIEAAHEDRTRSPNGLSYNSRQIGVRTYTRNTAAYPEAALTQGCTDRILASSPQTVKKNPKPGCIMPPSLEFIFGYIGQLNECVAGTLQ